MHSVVIVGQLWSLHLFLAGPSSHQCQVCPVEKRKLRKLQYLEISFRLIIIIILIEFNTWNINVIWNLGFHITIRGMLRMHILFMFQPQAPWFSLILTGVPGKPGIPAIPIRPWSPFCSHAHIKTFKQIISLMGSLPCMNSIQLQKQYWSTHQTRLPFWSLVTLQLNMKHLMSKLKLYNNTSRTVIKFVQPYFLVFLENHQVHLFQNHPAKQTVHDFNTYTSPQKQTVTQSIWFKLTHIPLMVLVIQVSPLDPEKREQIFK